MNDLLQLGFEFFAKGVDATKAKMRGVEDAAEGVEKKQARVKKSTDALSASFGRAIGVAARMAGAYLSVTAALRSAETYTQLSNSLKVLGFNGDQVADTLRNIARVANETRSPLESMASLYQKVSIAGKDLNTTNETNLRFTKNIGLALAQQGGSAAAASGALMQLGQALSGGIVRAEEFNSILEGAFPIAQAAANGIDAAAGSVGKLRTMVIEGEISSKEFFDAILSQSDALEEAFANTVPTIGQAFTVLSNKFLMFIGQANTAGGVTAELAKAILFLGNNVEQIIAYAAAAATIYGVTFVGGLIAAAGATGILSAAMVVLRAAIIGTGIGLLIVALGQAFLLFGDLINITGSIGEAWAALGPVASEVWDRIKIGFVGLTFQMKAGWYRTKADAMESLTGIAISAADNVNSIIGFFVGAYNGILAAWGLLPEAFANLGARAINAMIAKVSEGLKAMVSLINLALPGIIEIPTPDLSGWEVVVPAAANIGDAVAAEFNKAQGEAYAKTTEMANGLANSITDLRAGADIAAEFGDAFKDAATKPLNSVEALRKAVEDTGEASDDAVKPTTDLNNAIEDTGKKSGGAAKKVKELLTETEAYNKTLQDAAFTAEDFGTEKANIMISGIDGVSDAFADWIGDGFTDFKSFAKGILSTFQDMLKSMISMAIKNKIMIGMGISATGVGGAAAAGQVAGAPGGGGILGAGGALGGLGGIGSALAGGFMNSVGGFLGGGLSGGFGAIGAQVGTAFATGTGTAIAGAIGAIAAPLLAVAAVFSFFKSKTKELDAGLRVTIDGMATLVETFSTIEKKKFWGLSKKVSTSFTAAEASVADPLEAIVAQMQGSVLDAAGSLGVGAEAYEAFAHEVQISTKGLSEEDAQRAVVEALNGIGNAFAALTPDLEQFMREGEESGDTLTRLASDLGAVNLMMDTLGHTLQEATVIGAGTASDFAAMFGGIQAMNAATTAFFTGFYSEAERFATAQRQIEAQFSALGVTTPQTRDQFRAMVDALDLTTESGRRMYAALVSMSSALDAVLPAVSSFTAQIAAMVGTISTEIDAIIGETTTAMRSNEQAAALWYRTADTLRGVITDMRSTAGVLISGVQAREFSEARFQTLLASAMAGDSGAAAGLGAAARTLLDNTKATATSALEVARAEARVISDLQLAGGVSDIEGARHDVIAGLMGQQVELLEGVRDAINSGDLSADDIDGLNAQMGALEDAIKAAEMINYAFLKERLDVAVDLIATSDIPQPIRDLLANTATGITATIDYIVRAPDLTPDLRWLALTASSEHIKTITMAAEDNLHPWTRWIAVTQVSELDKTVNLVLGSDLAPDIKRIALAGSSELSRTVNAVLGSSMSEDAKRMALMRNEWVAKTIQGVVDTSSLEPWQLRFLQSVTGSAAGTLTLGGAFSFDPTSGFTALFGSITQTNISAPMTALRASLTALTDQIRADMADRAAAAARAQYLAGLQAQLGTVAGTRQTAIDEAAGVMGQIRDLEARTGVDIRNGSSDAVMGFHAGGNVNYRASHVSYGSGSDLAGFNSAFRGPNGLEAQLMALGQIPASYNQQINGLRAQIAGMGAVPAFATGGTHMGGLRMVGENGPELEVTGPSRIYSAPQTRAMMSGGDNARLEMLVVKLTEEVARMRDENTQLAKNRGTDLRRVRLIEERRAAAEELL